MVPVARCEWWVLKGREMEGPDGAPGTVGESKASIRDNYEGHFVGDSEEYFVGHVVGDLQEYCVGHFEQHVGEHYIVFVTVVAYGERHWRDWGPVMIEGFLKR